jgi:hypothetical protein
MLHRMHHRGQPARLNGAVALVATDTGDAWVVAPQPRSLPPSLEHRRGSATSGVPDRVEASAEVLYRLLWKRVGLAEADVRLVGDEERVRTFLASPLVP